MNEGREQVWMKSGAFTNLSLFQFPFSISIFGCLALADQQALMVRTKPARRLSRRILGRQFRGFLHDGCGAFLADIARGIVDAALPSVYLQPQSQVSALSLCNRAMRCSGANFDVSTPGSMVARSGRA